jgi:hypothetical protein
MDDTRIPIRVAADGRLIVPKKIVSKHDLKPGDLVDAQSIALRKAQMDRRTMLRWIGAAATGSAVTGSLLTLEISHNLIGVGSFLLEKFREHKEVDIKLLKRLFGVLNDSDTAIVPARHHPFQPLPNGSLGYDIEVSCANSYMQTMLPAPAKLSNVVGLIEIYPSDNVVAFGSQVSNFVSRSVLGDPFTSKIVSRVPVPMNSGIPNGSFRLRWNLCVDSGAESLSRHQYGRDWVYKPNSISDFHLGRPLSQPNLEDGDFLLVTVLPRDTTTNARVVIFGGLHGAGTLATKLLFEKPLHADLLQLQQSIGNASYYQALFDVKCIKGEPTGIRLRDAQALVWDNDPSIGYAEILRV